jgi:hypothetical protein
LEEKEQTQMAEEGQIAACQNGTGNEEGMAKMEDKTEEKEVNITKSAETVDVSPKQQAVEEEKKQPSLIMSEEQPEAVQVTNIFTHRYHMYWVRYCRYGLYRSR